MRRLFITRLCASLAGALLVALTSTVLWDRHASDMAVSESANPVTSSAYMGVVSEAEAADRHLFAPSSAARARMSEAYGKLPLSFEANVGQMDAQVRFLSRGPGYNLFLTSMEAVLSLRRGAAQKNHSFTASEKGMRKAQPTQSDLLRMKLLGSNPMPQVKGRDEMPAKINYFIGNDPSKWHAASNYARVEYEQVYPGVDLIYYGNQQQLEYDFVLAPGADPNVIKLAFSGAKRIDLDTNGDLILTTAGGQLRQHKPVIYQEMDGERKFVRGSYALKGRKEVGFEVGEYDSAKPLVIDPVLVYSRYIGNNEADLGEDIAVDSEGNAYVAGHTYSDNFPKVNGYPTPPMGHYSIFVLKLNAAGNTLLYSAVLAGADGGLASGASIALDPAGRVYVTASTLSANFPTKNAYQLDQVNDDVIVAKLDTTLSGTASLLYSTYLGGNAVDISGGIAADAAGHAYVTGHTLSSNFPTLNAVQGRQSREDVFVTKLDTNASGAASLLYSTYLGGVGEASFDGDERGEDIAADDSGNVYVTGYSTAFHFPTKNAYQSFMTGPGNYYDVFVTRLNTNVSGAASLVYSTYIGGAGNVEKGFGIAADSAGIAYVTGFTASPGFPVKNAFQSAKNNGVDVFVTKFDTNSCGANSLLYSTFLGGSSSYNDSEYANSIAADSRGNVYVTGNTFSTDFPTKNSLQSHRDGWCDYTISPCSDVFVAKLNTNVTGSAGLVYSTFLGGALHDQGRGIAVDSAGNAYITGWTDSSDFPANNSDPDTDRIASDRDLFVAKISDPASAPPPDADGDGVPDASDFCSGTTAGTTVDASGCPVACVVAPSGMVGWWPGDGDATDIRSGNDGVQQNGAAFAPGKVGQAFSFDGVDDYVSTQFTQTGPFTVDFWAKANGGCQSAFVSLLASASPANFPENTFQVDVDGAGNYRLRAGGTAPLHLNIGPTSASFQHLAVTYDGSVIKTYLNGQLSSTGNWTGAILTFTALRIGVNRADGAYFNGLIDEVEVFNRPLAQSEIQSIYNAGSAGKCKNRAPLAACQSVTVSAATSCTADASIDNGSSDPDGDAMTIIQSPAGPYPLGTTNVTLTVTDSNGSSSSCSATVTVVDATPPQVTPPANASYQCLSDVPPSNPSQATASDNCSTATLNVTDANNGGAGSIASPLTITRLFTATDAAGNTTGAYQIITVIDNTPPTIACVSNVTVAGNIPGSCGANVSVVVPMATDNCGVTSITGARSDGQSLNAAYPSGLTTINWTAVDAAGNSASCQQTVTVTNPAAVVTITGPPTGSVYPVNTLVNFTGSFTDNAGGMHTATWTFDNLTTSAGSVNEATGEITGSHTFTAAGVYKVTLTVSDGCGGVGSASTIDELDLLVVIYDPSAGWVTGGGWINSPAGAYSANPGLSGKANFGFVSRYHNGATVPTGNTEFQFKAGNLSFSSHSYEWLVIAGARAQYKGSGKINGAGDYDFVLTAIDGQQPGGGVADKFRIRIWDRSNGGLIYDNQLSAPDSDDPTTTLSGGNIVIHK